MKTICKHAYPADLCGICSPIVKEMKTPDTPDTPRTNAASFHRDNRMHRDHPLVVTDDFARELERELNDAIAEATNAGNDIIAVRYQRDQLAEALEEMRYGHTDKAESMAIAALADLENAKEMTPPLTSGVSTVEKS